LTFLKNEIDPALTEADESNVLLGVGAFYTGDMLKYGIEKAGSLDVRLDFSFFSTSPLNFLLAR